MRKVKVTFYATCREMREPMVTHTQEYDQEDWENEDKHYLDLEAQNMAYEYLDVSGWYEVENDGE